MASRRWKIAGVVLVLVVAALAVGAWKARRLIDAVAEVLATDELDGKQLDTADEVWGYLRAHPDRFALAAWDVGDEANGVFLDAETDWPLASTVKVVPLMLACHRLEQGVWTLDRPLSTVERFYLPGTDGQAHPKARETLDGGITTVGAALTAMIEFSDNAATDALLFELGRQSLETEASLLGVKAPHPLSGDLLVSVEGLDGGLLDDRAWALASTLNDDVSRAEAISEAFMAGGIRSQIVMASTLDNRGSARAFARLLEQIFTDETQRYAPARERLSWPMRFAPNQERFVRWGTKGGALAGTLTSAHFVEQKNGRRRVLALFLHDLPFATWVGLANSYAQQKVELELLLADDVRALVQQRLGR
ncbi:MAG: serine hydrolase [Myxococcales bacterium]|nr:serine hydrolase [Myxococcales bacterium]MDP3505850.1 serine hydrolase [Myxococcales bacterium]